MSLAELVLHRRAGASIDAGAVRGVISSLTLVAATVAGLAAFFYPFLLSRAPAQSENNAHAADAPLVFGVLVTLAAALFLVELSSGAMNAKVASALAVMATAAAVLRVPPLPGGASAFYFLIILGGYAFGPRFGFLVGALALFVSSFATGGFGPWVPFQMFASGWLGLTAGWLGRLRPVLSKRPQVEIAAIVAFGALWGLLFGALMNIWFWPYVATGEATSWRPGMGLTESLQHYWAFYLLTSLGWDVWTAAGNVALLAVAGRPVLGVLVRFRDRFQVAFD